MDFPFPSSWILIRPVNISQSINIHGRNLSFAQVSLKLAYRDAVFIIGDDLLPREGERWERRGGQGEAGVKLAFFPLSNLMLHREVGVSRGV